jgi:hypothetical protein
MNGSSLPSPTGKHKVGRMSIHLTDENRFEIYSTEKKDKKRELVVWIWYPTAPVFDFKRAIYLPDKWSEADFVYGVKMGTRAFQCHSFENAPVAESQSTYPILSLHRRAFPYYHIQQLLKKLQVTAILLLELIIRMTLRLLSSLMGE